MGLRPRLNQYTGRGFVISTGFGKLTFDFHEDENGDPWEAIASVGGVGNDCTADAAAIGIGLSFALRLMDCSTPIPVKIRIVADKLQPLKENEGSDVGTRRDPSLPSAIAEALRKYLILKGYPESDAPGLRDRPDQADTMMFVIPTHFGKLTLDVHVKDNEPFEIIVNVGATGSELMADAAAIGMIVSVCLRLPSSMPVKERLEWFIRHYLKVGGSGSYGNGNGRVTSLPSAIARGLQRFMHGFYGDPMPNPISHEEPIRHDGATDVAVMAHAEVPKDPCPECGSHSLAIGEGCATCHSCGYSKCS